MLLRYLIKLIVAIKMATLLGIFGWFFAGIHGAIYFSGMTFVGTFVWMVFAYDSGERLQKLTKIKAARKYKIAF
jgi:uncharacterized RDD family membrane protein YckC